MLAAAYWPGSTRLSQTNRRTNRYVGVAPGDFPRGHYFLGQISVVANVYGLKMEEYFFSIKTLGFLNFSIDAESKEEAIDLARQRLGDDARLQMDGRMELVSYSAKSIFGGLLEYPPNSDTWIEVEELVNGVRFSIFRKVYFKGFARGFLKSAYFWFVLGILLSRVLDHLLS